MQDAHFWSLLSVLECNIYKIAMEGEEETMWHRTAGSLFKTTVQASCRGTVQLCWEKNQSYSLSSGIQATKGAWQNQRLDVSAKGLRRSRSLGLAPFSLTGANRVILSSLQGRQVLEVYRLVLQQLSTWSKLGCWVLQVTSHHTASTGGGKCLKPGCWKRVRGDRNFKDQMGMKAKYRS